MRSRVLFLIMWLTWANFSLASGENTVVEAEISTTVTGPQTRIELSITNKGATQVSNIRSELKGDLFSASFDSLPLLPPGRSHHAYVDIDLPVEFVGGNFYAPIVIQYTDGEETSISTTALAHFMSVPDGPRPFTLKLEDVDLGKGCRNTEVSVHNLLNTEMPVSLKLLSAPGITIQPPHSVASLFPGQTIVFEFELCNEIQKDSGQYPMYAISSTWLLGRLIQESASSVVNIETTSVPARFFRFRRLILGLALFAFVYLCCSWLYVIFKAGTNEPSA